MNIHGTKYAFAMRNMQMRNDCAYAKANLISNITQFLLYRKSETYMHMRCAYRLLTWDTCGEFIIRFAAYAYRACMSSNHLRYASPILEINTGLERICFHVFASMLIKRPVLDTFGKLRVPLYTGAPYIGPYIEGPYI